VGQRVASRIWDKSLLQERKNLYLPTFSIAEWLVQNWWSLLNEPCRWEAVPKRATGNQEWKWIRRHCLRAADSSLLLPALYIFHDGHHLRVECQHDLPGSVPNMPGEFLTDISTELDSNATQDSLAAFVNDTLDQVAGLEGERVRNFRGLWQAIQAADEEEQNFCVFAGRMGLDPYDPNEMTVGLTEFLERTIASPEDPIWRDLTEVAQPDFVEQQWSWITRVRSEFHLSSNSSNVNVTRPAADQLPPRYGYQLAREVRINSGLGVDVPIFSLEKVALAITGKRLRIEDRNHIPGQGIRAIVGHADGDIIAAGPQPSRPESQRFLAARSLYHAIVTSRESPRLVTSSYSWDQKASRAFAAELLAPQGALVKRIGATGSNSQIAEDLAAEYQVSSFVIQNQLENAGVPCQED
jgi:hypothetical protein